MKDYREKTYILYGLAMVCSQLIGYNVGTIAFLIICMSILMSPNEFVDRISAVPAYLAFIVLSIGSGLYFALCNGIELWTAMYWGQFYFLSIAILAIADKEKALKALKICTYTILVADVFTNILLFVGFTVPWSELPPPRIGETMSRYTGIKGNTLYSGSISFMGLAFLLGEKKMNVWIKSGLVLLATFNLFLAGSFRYYIIYAIALALYLCQIYKSKVVLSASYIFSITTVIVATQLTMFVSKSNFYRYMIWQHFIKEIYKEPLLGHGFHCMKLPDGLAFNINNLISSGVTESCILLIGYNFGIIILIVYLGSIATTLLKGSHYRMYKPELALFMGLTLDLFWGGSFDNALSVSLLLTSWYIININSTPQCLSVSSQQSEKNQACSP